MKARSFQVPHSCFVYSGTQRSDIHITPSNALHKWTLRVAQSLVLFNAILTSIDLAASLHVYRRQTNTKDDLISWTFDPCTNDGSKRADVRAATHFLANSLCYMPSQTLWVSCEEKKPWKLVGSALGWRNGKSLITSTDDINTPPSLPIRTHLMRFLVRSVRFWSLLPRERIY